MTELPRDGRPLVLVEVETKASRGNAQVERYQLPFGFFGEDEAVSALPQQLALARVRRGSSGRLSHRRVRIGRVRPSRHQAVVPGRAHPEHRRRTALRFHRVAAGGDAGVDRGAGRRRRPLAVRRAEQQLARDRRRGRAQGRAARRGRHQPRGRDHARADRTGLRQHVAAAGRGLPLRSRRHAAPADRRATLRPQPGAMPGSGRSTC